MPDKQHEYCGKASVICAIFTVVVLLYVSFINIHSMMGLLLFPVYPVALFHGVMGWRSVYGKIGLSIALASLVGCCVLILYITGKALDM